MIDQELWLLCLYLVTVAVYVVRLKHVSVLLAFCFFLECVPGKVNLNLTLACTLTWSQFPFCTFVPPKNLLILVPADRREVCKQVSTCHPARMEEKQPQPASNILKHSPFLDDLDLVSTSFNVIYIIWHKKADVTSGSD